MKTNIGRWLGRYTLLMACAVLPATATMAQSEVGSDGVAGDNDLGMWLETSFTKRINRQWSVGGDLELRLADNMSQVSRMGIGVGTSYKPTTWLRLSAGYEWIYGYTPEKRKEHYKNDIVDADYWNGYNITDSYWHGKHRVRLELSAQTPRLWRSVRVSARLRYQYTWRNAFDADRTKYRFDRVADLDDNWNQIGWQYNLKDGYPLSDLNHKAYSSTQYLRSRLKIEWDRKRCAWSPFVSYECYNDLTAAMTLAKTRLSIGTEYKINRSHSVGVAYMLSTEYDNPTEHAHIINVGYEYKF